MRHADGSEHDLGGQWRQVTLHAAVSEAVDREVTVDTSVEDLRKLAAEFDVEIEESWSAGQIVLELFEKLVEHTLIAPTFVRDYPVETRPLTRAHRDDPRLAESWDLVVFGTELATGYSELVDPVEQRDRLHAQSLLAAAGDPEAMQLDEDFLRAMEYGMPPDGRDGHGDRPAADGADRAGHPGDHPVPARAQRVTAQKKVSALREDSECRVMPVTRAP